MADIDPTLAVAQGGAEGGAEGLSKNEQKRRAKQESQAKAKAEKEAAKKVADAAKPAKPKADAAAEVDEDEEDVDPSKYFENRLNFVNGVKAAGGSAYPHKFHTSMQVPEYVSKYESVGSGEMSPDTGIGLAGRVGSKRAGGKGLVFFDLVGDGSKVQVFADASKFTEWASLEKEERNANFSALMSTLKRGDIIGVRGTPGKTRRGELSLFPSEMLLLTPCLHMLPKVGLGGSGLTDKETRYRQRYLDLIMNPSTRKNFITRTRIINFLKRYLDMHGFLEVDIYVYICIYIYIHIYIYIYIYIYMCVCVYVCMYVYIYIGLTLSGAAASMWPHTNPYYYYY